MNTEQFDKIEWTANMKCIFQDKEYKIAAVDVEERLIGIEVAPSLYEMINFPENGNNIYWKRCENITLISE